MEENKLAVQGNQSYYELTLRKTMNLEEVLGSDDGEIRESINKDRKPDRNFLDSIHSILDHEKHDLETTLRMQMSEFSRERFNSVSLPENNIKTAQKIFDSDEFTLKDSVNSQTSRLTL